MTQSSPPHDDSEQKSPTSPEASRAPPSPSTPLRAAASNLGADDDEQDSSQHVLDRLTNSPRPTRRLCLDTSTSRREEWARAPQLHSPVPPTESTRSTPHQQPTKQQVHSSSVAALQAAQRHYSSSSFTARLYRKHNVKLPLHVPHNDTPTAQTIHLTLLTRLHCCQMHTFTTPVEHPNVLLSHHEPQNTASPATHAALTPLSFIPVQEYRLLSSKLHTMAVYQINNDHMLVEMAVKNGAALRVSLAPGPQNPSPSASPSTPKFPNPSLCKCPTLRKLVLELHQNPFGKPLNGIIVDSKYVDTSKCIFLPPPRRRKKNASNNNSSIHNPLHNSNTAPHQNHNSSTPLTQHQRAVLVFAPTYIPTRIKQYNRVTEDDILKIISGFCRGEILTREDAKFIIDETFDLFSQMPNVLDFKIDKRGLVVVGDIHGNLQDMLYIFQENGLPSSSRPYLFLGDYVDRGSNCSEVILLAFALKLCFPDSVYMLRGNHESLSVSLLFERYNQGWVSEFIAKYDQKLFDRIEETFNLMPIAAIASQKIAFVHGGIGAVNSLQAIRKLNRKSDVQTGGVLSALLWSDPVENSSGFSKSSRGDGIFNYGRDVTEGFLKRNRLKCMIRSHTVVEEGYRLNHDNQVVTVFSCSSYNSNPNQKGSILLIDSEEAGKGKQPKLNVKLWRFHTDDDSHSGELIPLKEVTSKLNE